MKIPDSEVELIRWAEEVVKKCMSSQTQRMTDGAYYRQYYYSGSDSGSPALYNRCFSHVDRLSAYLFSPAETHFQITFDEPEKELLDQGKTSARYLSYEFHRTGVDQQFSSAVDWALVKGSAFIKTIWGHDGLESSVVQPECIGVYREDINGLDRQEAFCHQIFLTEGQFYKLIEGHTHEEKIRERVRSTKSEKTEEKYDNSFIHQIIIGGINPLTTTQTTRGVSPVFGGPTPQISPEVRAELIVLNELWVMDDDRQDWTTIQYVEPGIIIEGNLKRRNLTGIKGEQPFTQVCCNKTEGYFWGWSDLALLIALQDMLNKRMTEVNRAISRKLRPSQVLIGHTGISDQEKQTLMTPDGFVTISSPNAKMEKVVPDIPQEVFESIKEILGFFDDVGGWEAITKGQGEQGVRSGVHADTLVRTATPRLRDRALSLERQCGDLADFCFKLLQAKIARTFKTEGEQSFLLDQLPDGLKVSVDSHSSSPAFSQETKQLAVELLKSGAIDAKEFIMLTHPPNEDILMAAAENRAKAAAEEHEMVLDAAKKDPSLLAKIFGGKGKKK